MASEHEKQIKALDAEIMACPSENVIKMRELRHRRRKVVQQMRIMADKRRKVAV